MPTLIPELPIFAGMIYDWRTRGRPHTVWMIGAVVITLVVVLRGLAANTSGWLTVADFLAGFNGQRRPGGHWWLLLGHACKGLTGEVALHK